MGEPNKNHKKPALIFALRFFIVLIVIGGIFIGALSFIDSYKSRIYPFITINHLAIGGQTPDGARQVLASFVGATQNQTITINYNGKVFTPKLADLGVDYNTNEAIQTAYELGHDGSVVNRAKALMKIALDKPDFGLSTVFNDQKLNDYLSQINQEVYIQPVNATIKFDNGQFMAIPAQNGQGFDRDQLKKEITDSVNSKSFGEITLTSAILVPAVDDNNIGDAKTSAEIYLAKAPVNFTYTDGDKTLNFTAGKNTVGSWINFSPSGHQLQASLSDSQINNFIDSISPKIEIETIDREVIKTTGKVLREGQDGRKIDRDKLIGDIKQFLTLGTGSTTIAITATTLPHQDRLVDEVFDPTTYTGRYIEVNLSSQTLYAFDNHEVVNHFLISGGISTHPTITGAFHVYSKSRVTEMKGQGYDLPGVQWVSWWSGDYSIHGTYWHHNFGHPMSHGCINASDADAEWIYNWDDIGTPVWVH